MAYIILHLYRATAGDLFLTFTLFANLVITFPHLSALYTFSDRGIHRFQEGVNHYIRDRHVRTYEGMSREGILPGDMCNEYIYTLFTSSLPYGYSSIIWDLYLLLGEGIVIGYCGKIIQVIRSGEGGRSEGSSVDVKERIRGIDIRWLWREMFEDNLDKYFT